MRRSKRGWALAAVVLAAVLLFPLGGRQSVHRLSEVEVVSVDEPATLDVEPVSQPVANLSPVAVIRVAVDDGSVEPMKLEEYIYGVLAAEMPASFEPEALKAQAVAARTFAIRKMLSGGCASNKDADVCTDSGCCQAWCSEAERKKNWGGNYRANTTKLKAAVDDTAGQILTYDDEPILTLFHATSAGYTESVENVYTQKLPYLRSVSSPEDEEMSVDTAEELSRSSFCKTVNTAWPKARVTISQLEDQVKILSRFDSGRVDEIRLGGVTVTGAKLRRAIGIRSANFTIKYDANSIVFHTRGYGHGVGMSQNGANVMAREGSDYRDILEHYYTGVEIQTLP